MAGRTGGGDSLESDTLVGAQAEGDPHTLVVSPPFLWGRADQAQHSCRSEAGTSSKHSLSFLHDWVLGGRSPRGWGRPGHRGNVPTLVKNFYKNPDVILSGKKLEGPCFREEQGRPLSPAPFGFVRELRAGRRGGVAETCSWDGRELRSLLRTRLSMKKIPHNEQTRQRNLLGLISNYSKATGHKVNRKAIALLYTSNEQQELESLEDIISSSTEKRKRGGGRISEEVQNQPNTHRICKQKMTEF